MTKPFFPTPDLSPVHIDDVAYAPGRDGYLVAWDVSEVPWTIAERFVSSSGELSAPCCGALSIGPGGGWIPPGGHQGWSGASLAFDSVERRVLRGRNFRSRRRARLRLRGGRRRPPDQRLRPRLSAPRCRWGADRLRRVMSVYSGNDEPYTLAQPAVSKVFARRLGTRNRRRRSQTGTRRASRLVFDGCRARPRDEECRITGSARIQVPGASGSLKLRGARRAVRAGVRAKVKLKASRRVLRILSACFHPAQPAHCPARRHRGRCGGQSADHEAEGPHTSLSCAAPG